MTKLLDITEWGPADLAVVVVLYMPWFKLVIALLKAVAAQLLGLLGIAGERIYQLGKRSSGWTAWDLGQ